MFSRDLLFPPEISNPAYTNICYTNSVLQCLFNQQHFVNVCMSLAKLHDCELCRPEIDNNYYYDHYNYAHIGCNIYYSDDKNPGDADTAAGCIIAALQQLLAQYSFTRTPSVLSPNAIISSLSSKCNTENETFKNKDYRIHIFL